jgi:hypothetical protein
MKITLKISHQELIKNSYNEITGARMPFLVDGVAVSS